MNTVLFNGSPARIIGRGTTYRNGVPTPRMLVLTTTGTVVLVGNDLYAITDF